MLPFLGLLAVTVAWFLVPMLPALLELYRPSDIAPMDVVDRSPGQVAFFARRFRGYLEPWMAELPGDTSGGPLLSRLPDAAPDRPDCLVVVDRPVTLPGEETFEMELYARAPLIGGPDTAYRAVYAERELGLGERSSVLRWIHAGGVLGVGGHSVLRGRITSDAAVVLGRNVVFEQVAAPVISVGMEHEPPPELPASPREFKLPGSARRSGDTVRVAGNLDIPEGVRVRSSLVVGGTLRIGVGSIVEGSVKAHRDVELADEAQVTGSAVARRRIMTGAASWIGGPVIAEERIRVGRDAVVGGPGQPATVSAPEVELTSGATVYGQISAPGGGRTF